MRLIVYASSIDNHALFDIYIVKGAVVGNVVVGVLQVEPVAECFDTILNQFLLRRFRGDGVGLVVDGGGYALKADKREAVDTVIGFCFENQSRQAAEFPWACRSGDVLCVAYSPLPPVQLAGCRLA